MHVTYNKSRECVRLHRIGGRHCHSRKQLKIKLPKVGTLTYLYYLILVFNITAMISGLADGVIGIGIAATAVGLVAGGIAAALSRKK